MRRSSRRPLANDEWSETRVGLTDVARRGGADALYLGEPRSWPAVIIHAPRAWPEVGLDRESLATGPA